jgi:hypothetical protein
MNDQRRSFARVCGMVQYVLYIRLRRVKYLINPMISSLRVAKVDPHFHFSPERSLRATTARACARVRENKRIGRLMAAHEVAT